MDGGLVARACVPTKCVSSHFDAKSWLASFADIVGGKVGPPKGQDPMFVANMKAVAVQDQQLLDKAIISALEFADHVLTNSNVP